MLERFRETPDGALLGKAFLDKYAKEYPWRVGETYQLKQLRGVSITFVGVFESDNEVYNSIILAGRRYVQEINDSLGVAHQVYIRIDEPQNADAVIATLDSEIPRQFPFKTTTSDLRSFITAAVEDLGDIIRLSRLVIVIVLSVMLIAIANTISMATRDRRQELGILRSLGFRRRHVVGLVLAESLALAVAGGVIGLGASWALLNLQESYYGVRGVNMLIHVTPAVAGQALGIAALVGLLGGLIPAAVASRLNIVSSLRNVE